MSPKTGALDRLVELETVLERRRQDVTDAEARLRASRRAVQRVEQELGEYYAGLAAQERERDDELERRLLSEFRQASEATTLRQDVDRDGRVLPTLTVVDVKAEAELEGARRALQRAEDELAAYARSSVAELAAERLQPAEEAARELAEALEALRKASAAYRRERSFWAALSRASGLPLIEQVPQDPTGDLGRLAVAVEVPFPSSLIPYEEG